MIRNTPQLVVVVIGRNEGERLGRTLASLAPERVPVVYVDSGSSDESVALARAAGCHVVELDPARPFSAARARNEGFARALELHPEAEFLQFLDGDCALTPGWLAAGRAALAAEPDCAMVCGLVRELAPEASPYNTLCDLEWRQPPGLVKTAGGRFLVRTRVFAEVGGFRADVIAAEDDEFSVRVRRAGWTIRQLATSMGVHDAAITRFSAWFRRARRMGHGYAQIAALHGGPPERYFAHDRRKILFWGGVLPLGALLLAPFSLGLSVPAALMLYFLQYLHISGHGRRRGWSPREQHIYGFYTVIGRLPAILGLIDYYWLRMTGRMPRIIEYKGPGR